MIETQTINTHLSIALTVADAQAQNDKHVKDILADKQVLSMILKYAVEEFADYSYEEIANCISEVEISECPLDPGLTNLGKVQGENLENNIPGEGVIFFDIRFSARLRDNTAVIKLLLNVEAQRITDEKSLRYPFKNRIVFYLSRMISAQKETEFIKSDYGSLKKVISIWICMDNEADSIEEMLFDSRAVFGQPPKIDNDLMRAVIIRIRRRQADESKNLLIAMLEELLSSKPPEEKKRNLEEKYHMVMSVELERKVSKMGGMIEEVWKEGETHGRADMIIELVNDGEMSPEKGAKRLQMSIEDFLNQFAPRLKTTIE